MSGAAAGAEGATELDVERMRAAYALAPRERPVLRLNFIESADGAATLRGRSGGLGGPGDQRLMGVLRSLADVVLVGAGTLREEGYGALRLDEEDAAWRSSQGLPRHPRLAIVSASLELDPAAPVFAEAPVRPIVVTHAASPADLRASLGIVAEVRVCGEAAVDAREMLAAFGGSGLGRVLCEGGPHLAGTLLDAGLVDELCLTLSPVVAGGDAGRIIRGARESERRMRLVHAIGGADGLLFLRYARPTPAALD